MESERSASWRADSVHTYGRFVARSIASMAALNPVGAFTVTATRTGASDSASASSTAVPPAENPNKPAKQRHDNQATVSQGISSCRPRTLPDIRFA
jgi:hypothetical protein